MPVKKYKITRGRGHPWTEEEKRFTLRRWDKIPPSRIASILGRSIKAVCNMGRQLKKSAGPPRHMLTMSQAVVRMGFRAPKLVQIFEEYDVRILQWYGETTGGKTTKPRRCVDADEAEKAVARYVAEHEYGGVAAKRLGVDQNHLLYAARIMGYTAGKVSLKSSVWNMIAESDAMKHSVMRRKKLREQWNANRNQRKRAERDAIKRIHASHHAHSGISHSTSSSTHYANA